MNENPTFQIRAQGDRQIVITRQFDAPRTMVFDAYTKADQLCRWLGVQQGWTLSICELDPKAGGTYRFGWSGPNKEQMGVRGEYREVVRPERIVNTERFDEPWYPGECLITAQFSEKDGKTTLQLTLNYESQEARDGVMKTPMQKGLAASYQMLADMLATLKATGRSS